MSRTVASLAALALLAACERGPDPERTRSLAGRALRDALAYPQSSVVSIQAGDEAAEIVFTSPAPVADIAKWYRETLALNGWQLRSDQTDRAGTVTMYAVRGARPLWLTLRRNTGGPGTTYSMIGAIVETAGGGGSGGDSTR